MAIEVRLLKNEELPLANDFFNKIYKSNRTFAHFKWEFIDCPAGTTIYVAAIDSDIKNEIKIVGIQCAIPLMMVNSEGIQLLTAKSEDTLVDPAYRGQDIFNKMYYLLFEECKKVGIKYIWGFTPAYKPFVKLGFMLNFKSSQLLYVIKPVKAYSYLSSLNPQNKLTDKLKIMGLSSISKLKTLSAVLAPKLPSEIIYEESNFELNLIAKFNATQNKNFLFLLEDKNYISWRIFNNAHNNNYKNLIFKNKNKECIADIIINLRGNVAYIEQQVFVDNINKNYKKAIIQQCIKVLIDLDASIIRFLGFEANLINKNEMDLLLDLGFYKVPRGNWFVWKSLDENYVHQPEQVVLNRLYTQGIM